MAHIVAGRAILVFEFINKPSHQIFRLVHDVGDSLAHFSLSGWYQLGASRRNFSISLSLNRPAWAPTFWTTLMELIGAHSRALSTSAPLARAPTKVDVKASPAPVRSYGGLGSG